jgi:diguanylate cyclase (GGDEF)-like protein
VELNHVPTQEAILTLLIVAVGANVLLMAAVLIIPRARRRRVRDVFGPGSSWTSGALAMEGASAGGEGLRDVSSDAAREGVDVMRSESTRRGADGSGDDPGPTPTDGVSNATDGVSNATDGVSNATDEPGELPNFNGLDHLIPPEPSALVDSQTGLDSPLFWSRAIHDEEARTARYGRPATVVLAELDGLERLVERFGQPAADRLIRAVAATLRHDARLTDRVARLGPGQFGALLPETDEVQAINYVERVRTATDLWLEAGAVAVRLAIGWANVGVDQSLEVALRLAEDRLNADRRVMRQPPTARPSRSVTVERPAG